MAHPPAPIEQLPSELIVVILTLGLLSVVDLARFKAASRRFWRIYELDSKKYRSLVDYAASQLCESHGIYVGMSKNLQIELLKRRKGNWIRVLRFLQSVERSSDVVENSVGNMQITTGGNHTLLIRNSSVYSCGSSRCGVLGRGPETTQCVSFSRINFPSAAHVVQVSASQNHSAFVLQSGEVFTCGDNSSNCCGHEVANHCIFKPRLVEALKGVPCKQVAAGRKFSVFLTIQGHIYTCGRNTHGQLGQGDTLDRPTPESIALLEEVGSVIQIAAGPSYVLAVTGGGAVYSFGSGSNFCLGHGEKHDEFRPRAVQTFRRESIHVVRVSAGDDHAVALDSSGYVYTWGKGYWGALGHGDDIDKKFPEPLSSLKSHLAVQVCAGKSKTFVLVDSGRVYGFGWFGSLWFPDGRVSDKVMRPQLLRSLENHHVSQISTGLKHTVVVTDRGRLFGFGDNLKGQLGCPKLREYREPTEIFIQEMEEDTGLA